MHCKRLTRAIFQPQLGHFFSWDFLLWLMVGVHCYVARPMVGAIQTFILYVIPEKQVKVNWRLAWATY